MDRAELEAAIDSYLEALVARDPSRLPLAPNVQFTENCQVLKLGEGSWRTVTGRGTYSHYFADPEMGQAAVICTMRENGVPALLDLRLRLEDGQIAEIESLFIRDALAGARYERELGEPEAVWLQAVPEADRLPREMLAATANKYLSGMERCDGTGDYSFFDRECNRIEHALQTTNVKTPTAYGHSHDTDFASMTAEEQWKTGFLGFVTLIRDRRFPVVDVERQVVLLYATLDHNGTVRVLHQTTGKDFVVPPYFDVPRTLQVCEAFKVRGGKLYRIEMTLTEIPYGDRPPWPPRPAPQRAPALAAPRAELEPLPDAVLAAMKAHDASGLPLAADVRYTENGQPLQIGDGLWGTLTDYAGSGAGKAPGYRIELVDPEQGQAGILVGTLEESTPGVLYLRLGVQDGRIREIEAVAIRQEEMGERGGTVTLFQPRLIAEFDAKGFAETPAEWLGPAAPASRAELVAAAEAWFKAVETGRGGDLRLSDDCRRRDNGRPASGDPAAPPLDPQAPGFRPFALSPAEQIDAGYFRRIAKVRDLHSLADPEQGLVLSVAVLDSPGTLKSIEVEGLGEVKLPGLSAMGPGAEINSNDADQSLLFGARLQPNVLVPTSELVVQLTKVAGGRIARMESLTRGAPFGLGAGG